MAAIGAILATGANQALLAVRDRRDAVGRHAERGHEVAHGAGTTLAKGEVVLAGAALVAVTGDLDAQLATLLHATGVGLKHAARRVVEVRAVIGEVNLVEVAGLFRDLLAA